MDAEERKAELMSQNKMEGLMFKMDYDPRIIGSEKKDKNGNPKGIGNFIRKTSLDEFPQFWNVLKGDMSLVGTRPPTVDEWEQYELHHRSRMSIKPGITGMWQASGRSDITDFEEVVKLDTEYIEKEDVAAVKESFSKMLENGTYAQGEAAGREDGLRAGRLAEIKNTEREKKRADMAQSRIKELEAELKKYRKKTTV